MLCCSMRWRTNRSINAAKEVLNLEEQVSVSLTRNLKMLHPTYVIIDVSVFFYLLSFYFSDCEAAPSRCLIIQKINHQNTRTISEICSKRHRRRFDLFGVNFKQISHIAMVFSLFILKM